MVFTPLGRKTYTINLIIMLLAPPNSVLLLARLLDFIYHAALSAERDLRTILVVYDNSTSELTNDILCSSRLQSLYVRWSTVNIGALTKRPHDLDFQHDLPLTLAILQQNFEGVFFSDLIYLKIDPLRKMNNIILIYPFEINDTILAEFEQISLDLLIILVHYVNNLIKIICRSKEFDRTIFLNEDQFQGDIENLFYRPFHNMHSEAIHVHILPEPPTVYNTISSQPFSGSGQLTESTNGIAGVDLYLTQLIAERLNGTAKFHVISTTNIEELDDLPPVWFEFITKKLLMPLKAPAIPSIRNVEYLTEIVQIR